MEKDNEKTLENLEDSRQDFSHINKDNINGKDRRNYSDSDEGIVQVEEADEINQRKRNTNEKNNSGLHNSNKVETKIFKITKDEERKQKKLQYAKWNSSLIKVPEPSIKKRDLKSITHPAFTLIKRYKPNLSISRLLKTIPKPPITTSSMLPLLKRYFSYAEETSNFSDESLIFYPKNEDLQKKFLSKKQGDICGKSRKIIENKKIIEQGIFELLQAKNPPSVSWRKEIKEEGEEEDEDIEERKVFLYEPDWRIIHLNQDHPAKIN